MATGLTRRPTLTQEVTARPPPPPSPSQGQQAGGGARSSRHYVIVHEICAAVPSLCAGPVTGGPMFMLCMRLTTLVCFLRCKITERPCIIPGGLWRADFLVRPPLHWGVFWIDPNKVRVSARANRSVECCLVLSFGHILYPLCP